MDEREREILERHKKFSQLGREISQRRQDAIRRGLDPDKEARKNRKHIPDNVLLPWEAPDWQTLSKTERFERWLLFREQWS